MTVDDGAARRRLQEELRRSRPGWPTPYKVALGLGLAGYGCDLALIAFLQFTGIEKGGVLLTANFLTYASSREAAMLYAYTEGAAFVWVFATAVLNDLGAFFTAIGLVWVGVRRLQGHPNIGAFFLLVERSLADRRAKVDRWGTTALAGFIWLPAIGTGPMVAGALGVLAHLPPKRLLIAVSASATAVNLFWALAVNWLSNVLPDRGWWSYLPLLLIALLLAFVIISTLRQLRHRTVLPLVPVDRVDDEDALKDYGIRADNGSLQVDCAELHRRIELPPHALACHSAGLFLLVPGVGPNEASALVSVGLERLEDLHRVSTDILYAALREEAGDTAPDAPTLREWQAAAGRLLQH